MFFLIYKIHIWATSEIIIPDILDFKWNNS